jgi:hypothetical protein
MDKNEKKTKMKASLRYILFAQAFLTFGFADLKAQTDFDRIFVLTDIENEPDDAMSMVRLLVYANHFDIEGLAATTSITSK